MRTVTRGVLGGIAVAALGAAALQGSAVQDSAGATSSAELGSAHQESPPTTAPAASPAARPGTPSAETVPSHGKLPHPLDEARAARRAEALDRVLRGETRLRSVGDSQVVKLSDDKYAEMSFERIDRIFTVLAEFGDRVDPRTGYDQPGPVHNQIPEPDRARDNITYWERDFDRGHYLDLLFGDGSETFRDYYETQSDGEYSVDGDVSDWVRLPYNGARYGSNDIPSEDGYWNFVKDSVTAWYEDQLAQGTTAEEIQEYLATFDQWDRYDHDNDGNFDEPDGYLDNFQLVYANEGEEAGGGILGADAIWSHRWYAFADLLGQAGPEGNFRGGVEIGDTGIWVGDYTVQPENGGLGVFAHEFGHNLGLPDLYDTAGGENGTGFWTIMSSGSWLGHGRRTIGTTPNNFEAWSKLQLGWLDYVVASPDRESTHTLGTLTGQTDLPQAVIVPLPKEEVVTEYNEPFSGEAEWWSGADDNLNSTLTRTVDLTDASDSAALSAKLWHEIELGFDNLYVEVSTDGSESFEVLGDPISGSSEGEWVDLEVDLSEYVGSEIQLQFRYATDSGLHLEGAMLDDIAIEADGEEVFFDDVEGGAGDWDAAGWEVFGGSTSEFLGSYYIAENRQYTGYDATLETGPYNFGRLATKPNWADHFPYQNGILVWQWDERHEDNETSVHPGEGLILPIDARPDTLRWDNDEVARNRLQAFDATFGLEATDSLALQSEVALDERLQILFLDVPSQEAAPVFDDSDPEAYWDPDNPWNSVKVAGHGVAIEVAGGSPDGSEQTVVVRPSDPR